MILPGDHSIDRILTADWEDAIPDDVVVMVVEKEEENFEENIDA